MPSKRPRQYAVYVGKTRKFPRGEKINHGEVYKVHVCKPEPDAIMWTVLVEEPNWSLYIPYSCMNEIWEDWMPYKGEVIM